MGAGASTRFRTANVAPQRLRRRRDFLRAAKSGLFHSARAFKVQAVAREGEEEGAPPRFGFTVTKKIAGAVGRNRIRRRLKEAVRAMGGSAGRAGYDYVFVARPDALTTPFRELVSAMVAGLARLDAPRKPSHRHNSHRQNSKDRPSAS